MKRLKLNLDQLGEELGLLDSAYLQGIKGGYGSSSSYGGYSSWQELWYAMQNGYMPPEGTYNPGGYSGSGGYNGGWPGWYSPGSSWGGYSPVGGYGGSYGGYGAGTNATASGACVFDTMEYLSEIYGNYHDKSYWVNLYRAQNTDALIFHDKNHNMTGVTTSTNIMLNLMQDFSVKSIVPSDLNSTLSSGRMVLAMLANSGPNNEGHSIIIKSRRADGLYEIYDPSKSSTDVVTGGDLAGTNYLIAIN